MFCNVSYFHFPQQHKEKFMWGSYFTFIFLLVSLNPVLKKELRMYVITDDFLCLDMISINEALKNTKNTYSYVPGDMLLI